MKNIAIVQTAFLGDLLLTIPLLKRLKLFAPGAEIHLVARKGLREIFLNLGLVDHYYEMDKSKGAFKKVHSLPPCDLVLCPHQSITSARQVRKIKAPLKIGYKNFWNGLIFHKLITRPLELPEALRTLSLLAVLDEELRSLIQAYADANYDINTLRPVPGWASMEMGPEALAKLNQHRLENFGATRKIFVLAPGSVWATKRWTAEGYAELARLLANRGFQVVITGSPAEAEIGKTIERQASVTNLCGQLSLLQTLWLMAAAEAVVSNDSGAMHMSAAVGTPTVAIFGPTVLRFGYQPWQTNARVLERTDLDCRPCSPHGTHTCPLGHHHCMKWIAARDVEAAVLELTAASGL